MGPDGAVPRLSSAQRPETILETIMRFTPATLALAALFATVSSAGLSQKVDADLLPLSVTMKQKGDVARAAGNLDAASDAYESALAADPRNRAAYVALGDVARTQGLPGKAYAFYNDALELEPTDMSALLGQGQALADKGAITQGRNTLAKMKSICRATCPEIAQLTTALDNQSARGTASATGSATPAVPTKVPPPEAKP